MFPLSSNKLIVFVGILLLSLLALILYFRFRSGERYENLNPNDVRSDAKDTASNMKVIGWVPYWDQKNAFDSFKKNVDSLDYIALFWYRVDKEGNLATFDQTREDKSIIDFAKDNNVKVIAKGLP